MLALRRCALGIALVLACAPFFARADEISDMQVSLTVNRDASVLVTESITYDFSSDSNHGIYRDILESSPTGSLALSNLTVTDASGTPYQYTASEEDGTLHLTIGDPDVLLPAGPRVYRISYLVRGAIGTYSDHDEIYWNATGDQWSVPIKNAAVIVWPPAHPTEYACYVGQRGSTTACDNKLERLDGLGKQIVIFSQSAIPAGSGLTVAVDFGPGAVVPLPWWERFAEEHPYTLASLVLVLAAASFSIYVQWRDRKGRGTIIPRYEPPQHITPAEADVLVHGRVTSRTWPATLVDFAVRGLLKIEEQQGTNVYATIAVVAYVAAAIAAAVFGLYAGFDQTETFVVFILLILVPYVAIVFGNRSFSERHEYVIKKVEREGVVLRPFESGFLAALFKDGDTISTKEMRRKAARGSAIAERIRGLESMLESETARDTHAYLVDPNSAAARFGALAVVLVLGAIGIGAAISTDEGATLLFQYGDTFWAAVWSVLAAIVVLHALYLRPRLNHAGSIQREEWLGFKLYLETAEKYRLSNLQPDSFEPFLPYAMIFGVEREWAKAFEGLGVPEPTWYAASTKSTTGFSPAVFVGTLGPSMDAAVRFSGSSASGVSAAAGGGAAGAGGGGGGGGAW